MAKTLVVVPHEDDELSVAGQLLVSLGRSKKNESYVVFATNGDTYPEMKGLRVREAVNSMKKLGVEEPHVFFLGYGVYGRVESGGKHIYHCGKDEAVIAEGGFRRTYSIPEHPEYCFQEHKVHHLYTRENYKNDLKSLICDIEPDFIVCVDYDSHPDHRAVSLLFEECMGEILKNRSGYRPIIWKKFAYFGAWNGPRDYYRHEVTKNPYNNDDTDNPIFCWSSRIRIHADKSCRTALLRDNIIYKAALCHKTQSAWINIQSVCNEDVVYWKRNTNNLMLRANVSAESGNYGCLNDFVITNNADITGKKFVMDDTSLWHPLDREKRAVFEFEEPVNSQNIIFYESPILEDHIKDISVKVNDNYIFHTGELDRKGGPSVFPLEYHDIHKIEIKIDEWEGNFPGLSEVELMGEAEDDMLPEGIVLYQEEKVIDSTAWKLLVYLEYWLLRLKAFWTTSLFPTYYIMARKYAVIRNVKVLLPIYWVIDWVARWKRLMKWKSRKDEKKNLFYS